MAFDFASYTGILKLPNQENVTYSKNCPTHLIIGIEPILDSLVSLSFRLSHFSLTMSKSYLVDGSAEILRLNLVRLDNAHPWYVSNHTQKKYFMYMAKSNKQEMRSFSFTTYKQKTYLPKT